MDKLESEANATFLSWDAHRLLASRSYTAADTVVGVILIIKMKIVHMMILHTSAAQSDAGEK